MKMTAVNGVCLAYESRGKGEPLVLVHGSWVSRENWDPVAPGLAESFRVLRYDRRGHSQSERLRRRGSIREDVADLAAMIEQFAPGPVWVAGNSMGASITLRLAGERPDLLKGISVHEPPLYSLVKDDPKIGPLVEQEERLEAEVAERIASGDPVGAAEMFADSVAPGLWGELPPGTRDLFIQNAATFLDEVNDPEIPEFDLDWIRDFEQPALLTYGDQSPAQFPPVIARLGAALPKAEVRCFAGAGHVPHLTHPETYIESLGAFVGKHAASRDTV